MATKLTSNLKLRVEDTLTRDAKFNLRRIDTLGALASVDSTGTSHFKSAGAISLEPNSPDIGGTGVGGTVSISDSTQVIDLFDINATTIDFNGASVVDLSIDADLIADGSVSNTEFQYLDGATSNIQAQLDAIGGANQLAITWNAVDGDTITVTHSFGTRNVGVQVLDESCDYSNIELDSITRPNDNQVTLLASEAPSTTYRVLLFQVGT